MANLTGPARKAIGLDGLEHWFIGDVYGAWLLQAACGVQIYTKSPWAALEELFLCDECCYIGEAEADELVISAEEL